MLWLLWKVYHNWVVYHEIQMHSFLKVESLGETRCTKSWNQLKGYASPSLRYVMLSIREKKTPSLGKINVKVPHQRSPYAMKFEDRSHEETEIQQRCARGKAWNLAKNTNSKKKQGYILLARGRMRRPGCVNKRTRGKRVCCWFRSEYAYCQ